jgi:hypothetical protein
VADTDGDADGVPDSGTPERGVGFGSALLDALPAGLLVGAFALEVEGDAESFVTGAAELQAVTVTSDTIARGLSRGRIVAT